MVHLHGFHKVGERLGGTKKRLGFVVFRVFQWRFMQCDAPEAVSLTQQHGSEHGFADTYCVFQHGLEYWFQLAGRAGDDAQHLRRRCLLLQRFGEISGALAQFIQQPRILDGDDGLCGKRLEKRNLLIRKRFNLGTSKPYCSHCYSLAQQWNTCRRPVSQPPRESASSGKFLCLRLEINYMNRFPLENRTACNLPTHARETNTDLLRDRTPVGGYTQVLPVEFVNGRVVSLTEARRTSDYNLQHGLEFGRRSADDLKNLRCRRLLFPRIVQLAGEPRDFGFLTNNGGARSL